MSGITIEPSAPAAVVIDFATGMTVELDGGSSELTIEQTGTTVQIFNQEPDVTDLLAQYRLLSN